MAPLTAMTASAPGDLNKPGYFACYNNVYYWNTMYHPAPGDQISHDHYLDCFVLRHPYVGGLGVVRIECT